MTELQQYLAEEIAEDHVDGIITRREAIRRLGAARGGRHRGVGDAGRGGGRAHGGQERAAATHGHGHGSDRKETTWAPPATQEITFTAAPTGT